MSSISKGTFAFTSWALASSYAWDVVEYGLTVTMTKSNGSWIVKVS